MLRRRGPLLAVLAVIGGLVAAAPAGATPTMAFERLAGGDRYATAAQVARSGWDRADEVVLVSGDSFADALAGTYVAGLVGAPLLFTGRDALPGSTSDVLRQLGASRAVVVGGTGGIGRPVIAELHRLGLTTVRLAGTSRYATARVAAESGGAGAVGRTTVAGGAPVPTAVVVSGERAPDALAAGPLSYAAHVPLLLTAASSLSPEVTAAVDSLGIRAVVIVGGTGSVGAPVEAALRAHGLRITRVAGSDRTDTAAKVADLATTQLGFGNTAVGLAPGDAFVEALAGAALAGRRGAPALLTANRTALGDATRRWLVAHGGTIEAGSVVGASSTLADSTEAEARAAVRGSSAGGARRTPSLAGPAALVGCEAPRSGTGRPFCTAPAGGVPTFTGSTVRAERLVAVHYDVALDCSSFDGSEFRINWTKAPQPETAYRATVASCSNGARTVELSYPAPIALQNSATGVVTVVVGSDGDTVLDAEGRAQPPGSTVTWTAPPPVLRKR